MNARIALALGASLALHAAALSYVAWKGLDPVRGQPASSTVPGAVMLARLVVDDKPVPQPVMAEPLPGALPVQPAPPERTVAAVSPAAWPSVSFSSGEAPPIMA